jgi:hypothetical protein
MLVFEGGAPLFGAVYLRAHDSIISLPVADVDCPMPPFLGVTHGTERTNVGGERRRGRITKLTSGWIQNEMGREG